MAKQRWKRREMKLEKKRTGMKVVGRSVFTLQEILGRKAEEARNKKSKKSKKHD